MKTIPQSKTPTALQLLQWILNPTGYLNTNFHRYGDIFSVDITGFSNESIILVNHPQALQYILTHDTDKELSAPGEVNQILKPLLGEHSVILLSEQQHRRRRQLIMPPFHGERLQAYGQLICQITREVSERWSLHEPIAVRQAMQQITMRVILQAVFGLYSGERYQRLEKLLSQRLEMTNNPLTSAIAFFPILQTDLGPWSPGRQIQRLAKEIDNLIFAEIQERRANFAPERQDILSLLLSARDEDGQALTDRELRDELMTLLVAGHETTATALTWALYWIHRLPAVQQQLRAELASCHDASAPSILSSLPYLTAVCNETLRIHPVAMLTFPRRLEVPLELMGYSLKPGMLLMGCIYLVHQREELYPEPGTFRPERFLERQFSPYQFLPFGGGVRRCVGAALAQYEMKLVLGTILSQCELEMRDKVSIQPQRRGLTLAPGKTIWLRKTRNLVQPPKILRSLT